MPEDATAASPDVAVNILHDPLAEDITEDSPDVAENTSDDHPSAAVPVARAPNRNSLTTVRNRRSRFSELIEPLSFESESAADNEGASTSPPRDSDSDYHGPTICSPKWLLSFTVIVAIFIITASPLKHHIILGSHLWKFPALLLAGFYAALMAHYTDRFAFSIAPRRNYVFYRTPRGVRTYFCIALIYFTFAFCVDESVLPGDVRHAAHRIRHALLAFGGASVIWQLEIMMFEMFRVAFHRKRFCEKLKGAALDLYMLDALVDRESGERRRNLSGPMICIMKMANEMMVVALNKSRIRPRHDADRLLLESIEGFAKSRFKADHPSKILKAAKEVFTSVAGENGFIMREDMEDFLTTEEVDIAFALMEDPHDVGKISEASFLGWMVEAYQRRKSLVHAIIDTETIVCTLNIFANIAMAKIMFMIALVLTGLATNKVLVASFSPILLLGFVFQNTAKNIFECIIFIFVRQPFDVGDCCIIDGVKMIGEQINIMTTVFLGLDREKICYPNSELLKKPISNSSRSPQMGEKIEFSIGISTPDMSVSKLGERIKQYLESKPEYWQPTHSFFVTGIEDSKKKMDLEVFHRKGYQNFYEMKKRKSELLAYLNTILQDLGIENHAILKETTAVRNKKDDSTVENPLPSVPKEITPVRNEKYDSTVENSSPSMPVPHG